MFFDFFFRLAVVPQKNCAEICREGFRTSGIYTVRPNATKCEFKVFCDMLLQGGGWTVIMRRVDGSMDFQRPWDSYVNGFGDLGENFFLGLESIRCLTAGGDMELWIGLQSHDIVFPPKTINDIYKVAHYTNFKVGDASSKYQLTISGYNPNTSTAGDSFSSHNGTKFSTFDQDNDESGHHCAQLFKSGWWYQNCHDSNLNGVWRERGGNREEDGIVWRSFTGPKYSLKTVVMAVRPKNTTCIRN